MDSLDNSMADNNDNSLLKNYVEFSAEALAVDCLAIVEELVRIWRSIGLNRQEMAVLLKRFRDYHRMILETELDKAVAELENQILYSDTKLMDINSSVTDPAIPAALDELADQWSHLKAKREQLVDTIANNEMTTAAEVFPTTEELARLVSDGSALEKVVENEL